MSAPTIDDYRKECKRLEELLLSEQKKNKEMKTAVEIATKALDITGENVVKVIQQLVDERDDLRTRYRKLLVKWFNLSDGNPTDIPGAKQYDKPADITDVKFEKGVNLDPKTTWTYTLEEIEPAKGLDCAVYQYWLRRNGCMFLTTDDITAIPCRNMELKLEALCKLLTEQRFNEM